MMVQVSSSHSPDRTRILGLDLGARRTGIAVSDELGLTARAVKTVETRALAEELAKLRDEFGVSVVVVGRPRSLDGSLGEQAARIDAAVERLKAAVPGEYVYEDETGTTKAAAADADGTDAEAARVILQGYLNERA
jgi:putative Holliday junction resolvase